MTRLFSTLKHTSLAICAALSLAAAANAATTIQFDGKVEGATFAGYTPNSLADLTFSFDLELPDVTTIGTGNFNNIVLDSFSGVTVGNTVYDTTNTTASVNIFGGFLLVSVSGVPNGIIVRGGTDDFRLSYSLTRDNPALNSLQNALLPDNDPTLIIAQLTNADNPIGLAGSSISGTVNVSQINVAPVPLPASFVLGLVGMAALYGVGRRRKAAY